MNSRKLERIAAILTAISIVLLHPFFSYGWMAAAVFVVAAIVFWFWSASRKRKERL